MLHTTISRCADISYAQHTLSLGVTSCAPIKFIPSCFFSCTQCPLPRAKASAMWPAATYSVENSLHKKRFQCKIYRWQILGRLPFCVQLRPALGQTQCAERERAHDCVACSSQYPVVFDSALQVSEFTFQSVATRHLAKESVFTRYFRLPCVALFDLSACMYLQLESSNDFSFLESS